MKITREYKLEESLGLINQFDYALNSLNLLKAQEVILTATTKNVANQLLLYRLKEVLKKINLTKLINCDKETIKVLNEKKIINVWDVVLLDNKELEKIPNANKKYLSMIEKECLALAEENEEKLIVDIDSKNKTNLTSPVIHSLYMHKMYLPLKEKTILFLDQYEEGIKNALKLLKKTNSNLKWKLATKKTKLGSIEAFKYLKDLSKQKDLNDTLNLSLIFSANAKTTPDVAFEDFKKSPEEYQNIINKIIPNKFNLF